MKWCKQGKSMSETSAHILVIDDDPSILEMMRMILESEGNYRVTTAALLFEQVSHIEQVQPDLILLDFVVQQRQAGWHFLQKLKRHRPTKEIPVVLCTAAQCEVKEQEATLAQKGIPVVYKPFDLDALLHVVKQTLTSSKRAKDLTREESASFF